MRRLELVAAILVLATLVGLPAATLGYEAFRHDGFDGDVITLAGAEGRWSQETVQLETGQKVRLRLTSNDVVHGFMLKGYDIEVDEVYPGKVKVIDFVADEEGTFMFTCTVLCSSRHRSMEGTLVVGSQGAEPASASAK